MPVQVNAQNMDWRLNPMGQPNSLQSLANNPNQNLLGGGGINALGVSQQRAGQPQQQQMMQPQQQQMMPQLVNASLGTTNGTIQNNTAQQQAAPSPLQNLNGIPTERQGSFTKGYDAYMKQLPILSPEQQEVVKSLLPNAYQRVMQNQADFEPIATKAREDFNRNTVPSLANRFAGFGGGTSTDAYQNAMARAHGDFESGIAALRGQYTLQKQTQDQGLLSSLLQPQYQNLYFPAAPGFFESAATKAIPALIDTAVRMAGAGGEQLATAIGKGAKGAYEYVMGQNASKDPANKPIDTTKDVGKAVMDAALTNPEIAAALNSSDPEVAQRAQKAAQDTVSMATKASAKGLPLATLGLFAAFATAFATGAAAWGEYQDPADTEFDKYKRPMSENYYGAIYDKDGKPTGKVHLPMFNGKPLPPEKRGQFEGEVPANWNPTWGPKPVVKGKPAPKPAKPRGK